MAENTRIEWADHSFNPWTGCTKISPGCDHCYAEGWAKRSGHVEWGAHGSRRRTSVATWGQPLKWNAAAAKSGTRARVFCASLSDVFDNHRSIQDKWRTDLWRLIWDTPHLDWLLLTKRPQNIAGMLPDGYDAPAWGEGWQNVWLGTTAENQTEADRRIPQLLACPAAMRFISAEPLLGLVDLHRWMGVHHHPDNNLSDPETAAAIATVIKAARDQFRAEHGRHGIDWVICGGESGPKARPMHPDWARSLRDQCQAAGVAFLFKQWGEWVSTYDRDRDDPDWRQVPKPGDWDRKRWLNLAAGQGFHGDRLNMMTRIGKKAAGRLLDGREWNEAPQ